MAFDPDAYLAKKQTSGGFNPDAYLASKGAIPTPTPTNPISSAFDQVKSNPAFAFSPTALAAKVPELMSKAAGNVGEKTAEYLAGQTTVKPPFMKPLTLTNPNPVNPLMAAAAGTTLAMAPDIAMSVAAPIENPQTLDESAQNQAMKAYGFSKRFINRAPKLDKARQAVQTMMDQGALKSFASPQDLVEETKNVADQAGQKIGAYLDGMNKKGQFLNLDDAEQMLNDLRPKYGNGKIIKVTDANRNTSVAAINQKIDRAIAEIRVYGKSGSRFDVANKIKGVLQNYADFSKTDPMGLMDRVIAGKFRDFLDSSLEKVASESGNEAAHQDFLRNKKIYSSAMTVMDPLYNRISSELGNKGISLTDWILAAGEMGAGNPIRAAAMVGGKRLGEKYLPQVTANVLNTLAKSKIPAPPQFGPIGTMTRLPELLKRAKDTYTKEKNP